MKLRIHRRINKSSYKLSCTTDVLGLQAILPLMASCTLISEVHRSCRILSKKSKGHLLTLNYEAYLAKAAQTPGHLKPISVSDEHFTMNLRDVPSLQSPLLAQSMISHLNCSQSTNDIKNDIILLKLLVYEVDEIILLRQT